MVPLVPSDGNISLEQFVGEDGIDLSVVDDCLRARPAHIVVYLVVQKDFQHQIGLNNIHYH